MTALYGGLLAGLVAVGIVVVAWSFLPKRPVVKAPKQKVDIEYEALLPWFAGQLALTVIAWYASGWVAVGLGLGAMVWVVRLWMVANAERSRYHEITEAISVWVDMIKDALASGAGLSQAIEATTKVAPAAIRSDVIKLVSRQRSGSQLDALREFGESLAHPTSDLVVMALASASESQARDLPGLLAKTAEQARARNEAVLQIETERSQLYAEARAMVLAIAVLGVIISLVARDFLEPYNSFLGQIVLAVVMSMVVGSAILLVQAGRPKPEQRLLAQEVVVAP